MIGTYSRPQFANCAGALLSVAASKQQRTGDAIFQAHAQAVSALFEMPPRSKLPYHLLSNFQSCTIGADVVLELPRITRASAVEPATALFMCWFCSAAAAPPVLFVSVLHSLLTELIALSCCTTVGLFPF